MAQDKSMSSLVSFLLVAAVVLLLLGVLVGLGGGDRVIGGVLAGAGIASFIAALLVNYQSGGG